MKEITPFLWFDDNVEEAINLYVSLIPNSRILDVSRYGDAGPGPKGTVMTATFELNGQRFTGLNGGPIYKFTEAFSIFVNCETQEEVDRLWDALIAERRRAVAMRLAEGQVRAFVADHPDGARRVDGRP